VVDVIAQKTPDKTALVWCNKKGEEAKFTFQQLKTYSDKTATFFTSLGIRKGDAVMLVLKRRFEF
jgi:acetyl-CoA synthetase